MMDLTGRRYGHWTVLRFAEVRGTNKYWLCQCDCGTVKPVSAGSLSVGTSQSCGCAPKSRPGRLNPNFRHGSSRSLTYNSWTGMRQRCNNPRNPRWDDYGGRGIKVCARWDSYANFLADMGERPPGMSLERKDNDGNYEPGNCKWASQAEQVRNRRGSEGRLRPDHIPEIQRLLDAGLTIWEIADAVEVERHIVGYVALTIEALRQFSVTVPPEQYLRRLENIERMAEHETEPKAYHQP